MTFEVEYYDDDRKISRSSYTLPAGQALGEVICNVWIHRCQAINRTEHWALVYQRKPQGCTELLSNPKETSLLICEADSKYWIGLSATKKSKYENNYFHLPPLPGSPLMEMERLKIDVNQETKETLLQPPPTGKVSDDGLNSQQPIPVGQGQKRNRPAHLPKPQAGATNFQKTEVAAVKKNQQNQKAQNFKKPNAQTCELRINSNIKGGNGKAISYLQTFTIFPKCCTVQERLEQIHKGALERFRRFSWYLTASAMKWNDELKKYEIITSPETPFQPGGRYIFTYNEQRNEPESAPGWLNLGRTSNIVVAVNFKIISSTGTEQREKPDFVVFNPRTVEAMIRSAKAYLDIPLSRLRSPNLVVAVSQTNPVVKQLKRTDVIMENHSYEVVFVSKELNYSMPEHAFETTLVPRATVAPPSPKTQAPLEMLSNIQTPFELSEVSSVGEENIMNFCKVEKVMELPAKRTILLLSCPREDCDQKERTWKCVECASPIYYGYDFHLYCERCGRFDLDQLSFKCAEHDNLVPYNKELLRLKLYNMDLKDLTFDD